MTFKMKLAQASMTAAALVLSLSLVGGKAEAAEIVVTQKDKAFSTTKIEAKMGDTIVFKNGEADREHNVYSIAAGNAFELPVQAPGQSNSLVLDAAKHKPGQMQVECAIHRGMKLTVDIKP